MKKLAVILVTGLSFGLFASSAFAEPSKATQSSAVVASRPSVGQVDQGVIPPVRKPIDRMPQLTPGQREAAQARQDDARATQDMAASAKDQRQAAKEKEIAERDARNGNQRGAVGAELAAKHLENEAAKEKIAAMELRRQARMLRREALSDSFRLPVHHIKLIHR